MFKLPLSLSRIPAMVVFGVVLKNVGLTAGADATAGALSVLDIPPEWLVDEAVRLAPMGTRVVLPVSDSEPA